MKEQCSHNNGYSFLHMIQLLWQKKLLVISSTLFFTCLSAVVYFVYTPSYIIKARITPVIGAELIALNNSPIFYHDKFTERNFNPVDLFLIFNRILKSESTKQIFFKEIYFPSLSEKSKNTVSKEKLYTVYQKKLMVRDEYHLKSSIVKIIGSNPEQAQKMLNDYLALTQKISLQALSKIVERQKLAIESNLLERINLMKDELKNNPQQTVKNEIVEKDIAAYKKKYTLVFKSTIPEKINLYQVEQAPILSRNPKLKELLLLGFLGGMLISFLLASVCVTHKRYIY